MTGRTSSILGAMDVALASNRLKPDTLVGWLDLLAGTTRFGTLWQHWRCSERFRKQFVEFWGDTTGTEWLFILPALEMLAWIFNELIKRLWKLDGSCTCAKLAPENVESSTTELASPSAIPFFLFHNLLISFWFASQESTTVDNIKFISWVLSLFHWDGKM